METKSAKMPVLKHPKHWVKLYKGLLPVHTASVDTLGGFRLDKTESGLGACGAICGNICNGIVSKQPSRTLEKDFQTFLYVLRRELNNKTLFFLPVTYQMGRFKQAGTFLNFMERAGAKEVHSNPNRIHGPNTMHLWVYDPMCPEAMKAWEDATMLIETIESPYYNRAVLKERLPKWVWEEDQKMEEDPETKKEMPEVPEMVLPVMKKRVYIRDKMGRFRAA